MSPTLALSDLTSAYVSINLFMKEASAEGTGFAALETLLTTKETRSYAELLSELSIPQLTNREDASALFASLYERLTGYAYNSAPFPTTTHKPAQT